MLSASFTDLQNIAHTTSPSASAPFVKDAARVHRIPSRVRDDRDTPLWGTRRRGSRTDLGQVGTEIFLQAGLDREIAQQPVGQISRALFPSPLVREGGAMRTQRASRRVRGLSPRMEAPHPARTSSALPSPTRGEGEERATAVINLHSAAPTAARSPETAAAPRNARRALPAPDGARS